MTRTTCAFATLSLVMIASCDLHAQDALPQPVPNQGPEEILRAPPEKERWSGPFGGSFSASLAFVTDYAFRGISQTQRQVALQPSLTYETAEVGEAVRLNGYVGAWGSNVAFPPTSAFVEIDIVAGVRASALNGKLTADLGYVRFNYPGAAASAFLDYNEVGLVVGYDFGVAMLQGALRFSPNLFGNSGDAWYKWGSLSVPLSFLRVGDNVAFRVFGSLGNQYVERFSIYGIGGDNYWDWQVGLGVKAWGFDLSIAWVDTNLTPATCGNTLNCEPRAIFSISRTF